MSDCSNTSEHDKHLCKLAADGTHRSQPEAYAGLVKEPRFVCKSCGRAAADSANLCNPILLGTFEEQ